MNTPNPLVPKGALHEQTKSKSTVRIAVLAIVAIHAAFFGGMLIQGCGHGDSKTAANTPEPTNELPKLDAYFSSNRNDVLPPAAVDLTPTNPTVVVSNPAPIIPEPAHITPIVTEAKPDTKEYVVKRGDNPSVIAKAQGVSVEELLKANPSLDPKRMMPGQKVQIPAAAAKPGPNRGLGFVEPAQPAGESAIHLVKSGENLTQIAKKHHVTVAALKAANGLKTDRINAGLKLKLPAPSVAQAPSASASTGGAVPSPLGPMSALPSSNSTPLGR